jgi:hypothetical protein
VAIQQDIATRASGLRSSRLIGTDLKAGTIEKLL